MDSESYVGKRLIALRNKAQWIDEIKKGDYELKQIERNTI